METKAPNQGICTLPYVPVRAAASEAAEMVTQVLFGEQIQFLEIGEKWLHIRLITDQYEGYVSRRTLEPLKAVNIPELMVISKAFEVIALDRNFSFVLPIGSRVPAPDDGVFMLNGVEYKTRNIAGLIHPGLVDSDLLIKELTGIPYIWGGRSGFGFDCSGLSQYFLAAQGVKIPRDASQQAALGSTLSFINEVRCGDLAFFDNEEGEITHVGVVTEGGKILHASGVVRLDSLDQQGIYNTDLGEYTHRLRVIKRYLD